MHRNTQKCACKWTFRSGVFIDGQIGGLSTGIIMKEVVLYQLATPEEQCALFYLILEHFC